MICTALSHPNSPRQRGRAVANLLERPRLRARIARAAYDAIVGERGSTLSGGQRLAIALFGLVHTRLDLTVRMRY
jgi:ABC-type bacteriocin/lantibiotic exporter with double-glycine peptidase domain